MTASDRYRVRVSVQAQLDLERLFEFLAANDFGAAQRARAAIEKAFDFLATMPFACRKAAPDQALLREIVIPFGNAGYVALFEIDSVDTVTVLGVRHQREDDYY